jgi:hypothetical protein
VGIDVTSIGKNSTKNLVISQKRVQNLHPAHPITEDALRASRAFTSSSHDSISILTVALTVTVSPLAHSKTGSLSPLAEKNDRKNCPA